MKYELPVLFNPKFHILIILNGSEFWSGYRLTMLLKKRELKLSQKLLFKGNILLY